MHAQKAQPTLEVSEAQAEVIAQVERALNEERWRAALDLLAKWPRESGEGDHVIPHLLRARAHFGLEDHASGVRSLRAALELGPNMRDVWLELATREGEANNAALSLQAYGKAWALSDAQQGQPTLADCQRYAWAAYDAGDARLATLLLQSALLRFPSDVALRELDAYLLADRQDFAQADLALRSLIGSNAEKLADYWQRLAHLRWQSEGLTTPTLAVIEAAALANPTSAQAQYEHVAAQFSVKHTHEAFDAASLAMRNLGAEPLQQIEGCAELFVSVALALDANRDAEAWLSALAPAKPSRDLRVLGARIAARKEKPQAALDLLWPLAESGESDAPLLLWIADLSRSLDDAIKEELALTQALTQLGGTSSDDRDTSATIMRLANLKHASGRSHEASDLLHARLQHAPSESRVRALAERIDAAINSAD